MYDLETIKAMNAERGDQARAEGRRPLLLDSFDAIDELFHHRDRQLPSLGEATEDIKAEELDVLFCDTSGFDDTHERALTQSQFEARLRELVDEHGPIQIGVGEAGLFQAYVYVWRADDQELT